MSENEKLVPLSARTRLGRYEIVRVLGFGGMGAVYEAVHLDLNKRVAIKTLLPQMARDPQLSARFVREGQAAARIRHPNVVDIYDVGAQDEIAYLVMEYLEGEDLSKHLARAGRLSPEQTADLILPVVAAIWAANSEGVLHRDLKPGNIFLSRDRTGEVTPKVLDFGISKIVSAEERELTSSGALLGTPYYMSPEQATGNRTIDPRSDQYSLGVILYQCVTGQRPFRSESMYQLLHSIVGGTFDPPRMVRPDLPSAFEAVILRAMAREADGRFRTVNAFGAALLPFASDRVRAVWAPTFPPSAPPLFAPPLPLETAPAPPEHASLLSSQTISPKEPSRAPSISGAVQRNAWAIVAVIAVLVAGGVVLLWNAHDRESFEVIRLPEPSTAAKPAPAPPPLEIAAPPPPVAPPAAEAVATEKPEPKAPRAKPAPTPKPPTAPKKGANQAPILR